MKTSTHTILYALLLCMISTIILPMHEVSQPEDVSHRYTTGDPVRDAQEAEIIRKQREQEAIDRLQKQTFNKEQTTLWEQKDPNAQPRFGIDDETDKNQNKSKIKIKIKTPEEKDTEFEQAQKEYWQNRRTHTKIADWFRRTSDQEMVKQALNGNPEALQELEVARQKLKGTDLSYRGKIEALNNTIIREIAKEHREIGQDKYLDSESKERAQRVLLKTALKLVKVVDSSSTISKIDIDTEGNVKIITNNTTITYDSQGNIKTLINNSMQQTSNRATREADAPKSKSTKTQQVSPEQTSRTSTSDELEARKALDAQKITTASKELTTKITLLTKKRIIEDLSDDNGLLNNIGQKLSDKTYLDYFIEQADKLLVPQNKLELFETFISLAKDSENASISTDDLIDKAFEIVAKKRRISEGEALRKQQSIVQSGTPKPVTTAIAFDYGSDDDEDND